LSGKKNKRERERERERGRERERKKKRKIAFFDARSGSALNALAIESLLC